MISLFMSVAFAANGLSCFDIIGDAPSPIIGTTGWLNALDALRINKDTYSAASFAATNLAQEEPGWLFTAAVNTTMNAARVPVVSGDIAGCPNEYGVSLFPLDLQATNLLVAWKSPGFWAFYSASTTVGAVFLPETVTRLLLYHSYYPAVGGFLSLTAPAGYQKMGSASSISQDWYLGAGFEAGTWSGNTGMGRSINPFFHLEEARTRARLLAVVDPFALGESSLDVRFHDTPIGRKNNDRALRATLGYQDLISYWKTDSEASTAEPRHREIDVGAGNFFQLLDVATSARLAPDVTVSNATLSVHSKGYFVQADKLGPWVFAQIGWTHLPGSSVYGLKEGSYLVGRLDYGATGEHVSGGLGVQFNDPEQLQLYPFARNALSTHLSINAEF